MLVLLCGCETFSNNKTQQTISVNVTGVKTAQCSLTSHSDYQTFLAPSVVSVDVSSKVLKFDCRYNDLRRVVNVMPLSMNGVYKYPKTVNVDFKIVSLGTRYDGYRVAGSPAILTEKSFNHPVDLDQNYPIRHRYHTRKRSMPVMVQ